MSYFCERCNKEVITNYGSGRFCSKSCAQKRDCNEALSKKFSEIQKKNAETLHKKVCSCIYCKKELRKRDIHKHNCKYMFKEIKICETCGKEHKGIFGSGRFCSRTCANKKNMSIETKLKISNSLKNNIPYNKGKSKFFFTEEICNTCGVIFKRRNDKTNICCSSTCTTRTVEYRQKKSNEVKLHYLNGKKVYGGTAKWLPYKDIKVQGTFELRMCFILDRMKEENEILYWEYTSDRIPYINVDGKQSMYLLDFKVYKNDEEFYYIETKGYQKDNDLLKWEAVRDLGFELKVYFEKDIKNLERK